MRPPLASILALARVSHYILVFPSFVTRSNLSSFATGSSIRAESRLSGFCAFFPLVSLLVHFYWCPFSSAPISLLLFSVCRLLSASEGFPCSFYTSLSCRLAFLSPLGLFLFLFLRLSLSPLRVFPAPFFSRCYFYCSLSILLLFTFLFYLIYCVLFHLLGRDSGKFSRLLLQVFSFDSSSPLRPLRMASLSIPAGPLCPGDTIACPLPYRLLHEPVVMVWSAHSHIGRCSCGDSGFIVWSALSFSWVSGCSAASPLVGRSP